MADPVADVARVLAALPGDPACAAARAREIDDWDEASRAALAHRVAMPLLYWVADSLPAAVREHFQRQRAFEVARTLKLRAETKRILGTLERADIPAVPMKGDSLAARLYPEPWMRPSGDVDVLVSPADTRRAIEALRADGFESRQTTTNIDYAIAAQHDVAMSRPGGPLLELHFRMAVKHGTMIEADPVLRRARTELVDGAPLRVFAPEDELLHLFTHAAGHFEQLGWLFDIKLWLERDANQVDWDALQSRARSYRLRMALAFAADRLHDRLGVETPIERPALFTLRRDLARRARGPFEDPDVRWDWANERHHKTPRERARVLVASSFLCDDAGVALRFVGHRVARELRRSAANRFPRITPNGWNVDLADRA